MDKILRNTLLYDFYAELLTKKRKTIYGMYFLENMTMEEIGEKLGVTRQAVNFSLKQTQIKLDGFEEKLGMLALEGKMQKHIENLEKAIETNDHAKLKKITQDMKSLF